MRGASVRWDNEKPMVHITKSYILYGPVLQKKTGLKIGQEVLFAINPLDKEWYFAILPELGSRRGYKVITDKGLVFTNANKLVERGLPIGDFILGDPVYNESTEIEWYPLYEK